MNRFFGKSENITESGIRIDGGDVNHMKNVLRLTVGDEVSVCGSDQTEYRCTIRSYEKDAVLLDIQEAVRINRELKARIHLFQGIPKGDKMERIIQKCVELGVFEIIPVSMRRCVVKLDEKRAAQKNVRWQAVGESAAKQCGRSIIPAVLRPVSFSQAVSYAKTMDVAMAPYELAQGMETAKQTVEKIGADMDVAVLIGPEGGFDPEEISEAVRQGITPISLGKRILRTETAGPMVLSVLMYHLETQE